MKILVIDDHHHTHRLIEAALAAEGWQVLGAGDGVEGLAAAEAHVPDAIVLKTVKNVVWKKDQSNLELPETAEASGLTYNKLCDFCLPCPCHC